MIRNLSKNRLLWILAALLSLIASLSGVINQDIYNLVVRSDMLPGTVSQDIITVLISLVLLVLGYQIREEDTSKSIVAISLTAYLFYAYGIYVIEQLYNSYYLLYMAIFALTFWSLIYALVNIKRQRMPETKLPKALKLLTISLSIGIPLLFYGLWTVELLPLMRLGEKIEFAYSIFILDMVFVLPAFLVSAGMQIKGNPLGWIFAPMLFFKAFTLLFSVGLGCLLKPLYNQTADPGETVFYLGLSALFLVSSIINFWYLEPRSQNQAHFH